jgi:hypothetical protein
LSTQIENQLADFYTCASVPNLIEFVPDINVAIDNHLFLPVFQSGIEGCNLEEFAHFIGQDSDGSWILDGAEMC